MSKRHRVAAYCPPCTICRNFAAFCPPSMMSWIFRKTFAVHDISCILPQVVHRVWYAINFAANHRPPFIICREFCRISFAMYDMRWIFAADRCPPFAKCREFCHISFAVYSIRLILPHVIAQRLRYVVYFFAYRSPCMLPHIIVYLLLAWERCAVSQQF